MAEDRIDLENPELQQALQIIQFTRRSLFLTGKAGTGKSTFLRYISAHTKKKHVILAPTGIAAINAGGSTSTASSSCPSIPCCPTTVQFSPRNIRKVLRYNSDQNQNYPRAGAHHHRRDQYGACRHHRLH
jgi:hypothetical protein